MDEVARVTNDDTGLDDLRIELAAVTHRPYPLAGLLGGLVAAPRGVTRMPPTRHS